ncbi:glycosyltransferase family 25 protein [Zhongshania marina]|uniref:Glycosyltransferase family 25 protein n=1 Tax=Zhongshania marina TaxID=2304603 RepID=A0ABX9W2H1_9GAMM|nr:glycosyltransferase family 25 protein [Zhongshania marina]
MSVLSTVVISLEPQSPTVISLVNALSALGFKAEVFSAIDGRSAMPDLRDAESVDQKMSVLRRRSELTTSEVGCFLSHARVIQQAFDNGVDKLLILEDDVEILAGFAEVVDAIVTLPSEVEMVRLMGLKRRRRKTIATLAGSWQLVRPLRGWCGAQAYVMNRPAMAKFLRQYQTISMPVDGFYDCFWETDIRAYGVEPHVAAERKHVSSIAKPWGTMAPSRMTEIRWHMFKLYRGVLMRYYRLANYSDFYPNVLPDPSIKFPRSNPD